MLRGRTLYFSGDSQTQVGFCRILTAAAPMGAVLLKHIVPVMHIVLQT